MTNSRRFVEYDLASGDKVGLLYRSFRLATDMGIPLKDVTPKLIFP